MKSSTVLNTAVRERAIIRKIQTRLLPFLFSLYVVAFLDRINIGFAALSMNKELAITSRQFGLATGIFFIGYFLFEVPSNLLLHKIGARIWIARILLTWGTVAFLTAFVRSAHELYIARFLLGACEAGFFPGVVLYLTYWFRQREQAQAIALFMIALPISTVIGSPLSGLILDRVHWLSLHSWRWLLIVEGAPAVLCGFLTYLLLPNGPVDATFLSDEEKRWVIDVISGEEQQRRGTRTLSATDALKNARVWHLALIGFTLFLGMYAVIFWMPQAVKSLSNQFSNTTVGFLVMIPYVAAAIAMILVSRSSDKLLERRYHVAIPITIAATSLVCLAFRTPALVSIVILGFVVAGGFSSNAPFWSMPSEFLTGSSAASGIALINSVANLGGFVGPYVIGVAVQASGRLLSGLALASFSLFISAGMVLLLPSAEKSKARNAERDSYSA
jgi:ACS family tartrate transporter-like MFS transporter